MQRFFVSMTFFIFDSSFINAWHLTLFYKSFYDTSLSSIHKSRTESKNINIWPAFLHKFHCLTMRCYWKILTLNRIQDWGVGEGMGGGGLKRPPISLSPVTFTNVGISPQNLLTFSFNPFATLLFNIKTHLVPVQIIELEPRPTLKKVVFLVKSLWNWGYDKVIKSWSHDYMYNIIWVTW